MHYASIHTHIVFEINCAPSSMREVPARMFRFIEQEVLNC